jgi:hypothetical protein
VFGTFGNVLDLVSSIGDPLGLLKKLADVRRAGQQNHAQTERDKADVGKGGSDTDSGSGAGSGTGSGSDGMTADEAKAKSEADLEQRKKELKERFKALGGRIDLSQDRVWAVSGLLSEAESAITDAQRESKTKFEAALNERDEEKKKQLQEEAARAQRKVDLARITYKRLEAECIDVAKEAEALDISRFELNALLGVGVFP